MFNSTELNFGFGTTPGRIIHTARTFLMKTYKNLYPKIYSYKNLELAFEKAKKNKSSLRYIVDFEKNLQSNLLQLQQELSSLAYSPSPLKRFTVRDPKTRTIHASTFRDRVVYHAICNIIETVFDKRFIHDSYANRKGKGNLKAVQRFDRFKRKISRNGRPIYGACHNNEVLGYVLKADIKHYFEEVSHNILLKIIAGRIQDKKVMGLIAQILNNFNTKIRGKGMPLGNLTSQFFANIYLHELDKFVKHKLKAKYYLRYVDDFIIMHHSGEQLAQWKEQINNFLKQELKIELHPEKSKITPLRKGIIFLGYRIFYHHKLLKKSNLRKFQRGFQEQLSLLENGVGEGNFEMIFQSSQGWFGYAIWANTYKLRRNIIKRLQVAYENKK